VTRAGAATGAGRGAGGGATAALAAGAATTAAAGAAGGSGAATGAGAGGGGALLAAAAGGTAPVESHTLKSLISEPLKRINSYVPAAGGTWGPSFLRPSVPCERTALTQTRASWQASDNDDGTAAPHARPPHARQRRDKRGHRTHHSAALPLTALGRCCTASLQTKITDRRTVGGAAPGARRTTSRAQQQHITGVADLRQRYQGDGTP
jgi:hypothetical protein